MNYKIMIVLLGIILSSCTHEKHNENSPGLPTKYLSLLEDLDILLNEISIKQTNELQIQIINLEEKILEEYPEYVSTGYEPKEGRSEL